MIIPSISYGDSVLRFINISLNLSFDIVSKFLLKTDVNPKFLTNFRPSLFFNLGSSKSNTTKSVSRRISILIFFLELTTPFVNEREFFILYLENFSLDIIISPLKQISFLGNFFFISGNKYGIKCEISLPTFPLPLVYNLVFHPFLSLK